MSKLEFWGICAGILATVFAVAGIGASAAWVVHEAIGEVRSDVNDAIGEVRSDIGEVRSDISKLEEQITGLDRHLTSRIDSLEEDVQEIKNDLKVLSGGEVSELDGETQVGLKELIGLHPDF